MKEDNRMIELNKGAVAHLSTLMAEFRKALRPEESIKFRKKVCLDLLEIPASESDAELRAASYIRTVLKDCDAPKIVQLVRLAYDFLEEERQKTVAYWDSKDSMPPDEQTEWLDIADDMFPGIGYPSLDYIADRKCEEVQRKVDDYSTQVNEALKKSDYIFVKGVFVPKQPEEIQRAIDGMEQSRFDYARRHIGKAYAHLNNQPPDYSGSMRESITAIESVALHVSGQKNFNEAISKLRDRGIKLHPEFAKALRNLYNFASDDGVRHAMPKGKAPIQNDRETAEFMLAVCSAVINFIESKLPDSDSRQKDS